MLLASSRGKGEPTGAGDRSIMTQSAESHPGMFAGRGWRPRHKAHTPLRTRVQRASNMGRVGSCPVALPSLRMDNGPPRAAPVTLCPVFPQRSSRGRSRTNNEADWKWTARHPGPVFLSGIFQSLYILIVHQGLYLVRGTESQLHLGTRHMKKPLAAPPDNSCPFADRPADGHLNPRI